MDQPIRFPARPPLPAFLPKPVMLGMMHHRPDQKHPLPPIFYYNLDDPKTEKKWRGPKEDITDYFNYGLTEETWKILVEKVIKLSEKVDNFMHEQGECVALNDRLPLEFGGFGKPHFEKIAQLPFLQILEKNKERFFYQYFQQYRYDVDEVKNQLQNSLTSDFIEENYNEVRNVYDEVAPGLLQLKHKLPQVSHSTLYRPRLGFSSGPGQPRPSLNPLKDPAVASITAGLQKASAAQKQAEQNKLGLALTADNLKSMTALFELTGNQRPFMNTEKREGEYRDEYKGRKYSENSLRTNERQSKSRKRHHKEEDSRSPKKEKKRKDKKTRSRSKESHKRRKDRKKSREKTKEHHRDREEESREVKKKKKKTHKEKHSSPSPPQTPPQYSKSDIRQRIQPRSNR